MAPQHASNGVPLNLDGWYIKEVSSQEATRVVVDKHYLHRKAPCSSAWGLYSPENALMGVVMYGVPASVPLVKGLLGAEYRDLVGELTRLWVDDSVPKNGESFLIGNTIKRQPFEVLVSFADSSQGHIGIVYQATNWIYTGLSSAHKDWVLIGYEAKHSRHIWDEFGGIEGAKRVIPERMTQIERPRKHRYVFINARKSRRSFLLGKLRYPIKPYPKEAVV